ncbi:MAG: DNA alkylation repair protein [Bacteroidales bacterium]|nr:DNA alkylation repair protein [Bacteroidales bacterium]
MTVDTILKELESYASDDTKRVLLRHGAREPFFGVKVQDLKKIVKKIKTNHELSLQLFATGNSDAMYLAGLIADTSKISKNELNTWAENAYWYYLSEYAVAWVAAESRYGLELALEWIKSPRENIASAGWATLSNYIALKPDDELDINLYSKLLDSVEKEIHHAQNRVRYTMNGFVIAVGTSIKALTKKATEISKRIGKVTVNVGNTSCKVPLATEYIQKVIARGAIGKKKKYARC